MRRETRRDLEQMLDLTELGAWRPPIVDTVATDGKGVDQVWAAIGAHRQHQMADGRLEARRRQRLERELRQIVVTRVVEQIDKRGVRRSLAGIVSAMLAGDLDPYEAADQLLSRLPARRRAAEGA